MCSGFMGVALISTLNAASASQIALAIAAVDRNRARGYVDLDQGEMGGAGPGDRRRLPEASLQPQGMHCCASATKLVEHNLHRFNGVRAQEHQSAKGCPMKSIVRGRPNAWVLLVLRSLETQRTCREEDLIALPT